MYINEHNIYKYTYINIHVCKTIECAKLFHLCLTPNKMAFNSRESD